MKLSILLCIISLAPIRGASYGVVDLVIFSKDRPLFLQALLYSIQEHITGLQSISVLYHASNDQYEAAYAQVQEEFPVVAFSMQDRISPRTDFLPILQKLVQKGSAEYCMFAVDDLCVIRPVSLELCVAALQQTKAYGFYLRLGTEITHCYMTSRDTPLPPLQPLGLSIYSWRLRDGAGDWNWPHTVDMTVYPRERVLRFLYSQRKIPSPNVLEGSWSGIPVPAHVQGLCFEHSPIINICVNMVQQDWVSNRCAHSYSTPYLLDLFEKGYRIDTGALMHITRNAPHVEIELPLLQVGN